MGIHTAIEWCDSSLNLQMGCDGCELWNPKAGIRNCYAGTLTERYAGAKGWPAAFDQPALFPERLKEALKWPDLTGKEHPGKPTLNGLPRLIFLDDMGDTFTESLPVDWLAPHLPAMADSPHVWMLLTKRPRRMRQFFEAHPCPDNFWLYTSVTDQTTANARLPELLKIGAKVRGVSAEPLLGNVHLDLTNKLHDGKTWLRHLSHVIAGGESGAAARPSDPVWFILLRDSCERAGVPFFFKQHGEWVGERHPLVYEQMPFSETMKLPHGVMGDDGFRPGEYRGTRYENLNCSTVYRVGKKAAGRTLDGRTWNEFPEVAR